MLDFGELGGNGTGLEQLVREVLLLMDLHPQWSGVGSDGGRDLLFDEPGLAVLGKKPRRWVVSCKDKSASGMSVGVGDIGPVVDVMHQHGAHGYLLVCTTQPSSGVVERLRAIETQAGGIRAAHIWDGATLERLLAAQRMWSVAQQFMPESTNAAGWKIFGTEAPNRWVAVHRGHYFHLANRVGGGERFNLRALDRVIDEILSLDRADVRMRL